MLSRLCGWVCVTACGCCLAAGQQQASTQGKAKAIETTTSLVLVDTLAEDKKSGIPIEDLRQEDFLVRDNGKPVAISSFHRGKDQTLRPIQLWFVLMCNEESHAQAGVRRPTANEMTQEWGVSFLAGKTEALRPALERLKPEDGVGVAHWCDDGQSEIDAVASREVGRALEAMDKIARKSPVVIEHSGRSNARVEVIRLINNVAQAAFPEPFLAAIFVGGKEMSAAGSTGEAWSGFMEISSLQLGLDGGGGAAESRDFPIQGSNYGDRMGVYIESLHLRYELGFVPGKEGKRLHQVNVALTNAAKEKYPNAVLRYREVYQDTEQPDTAGGVKQAADWRALDSAMRAAVQSGTGAGRLKFETQRAGGTVGGMEEFVLKIAPGELTWKMLPNGDRRSVVMVVVAGYSLKGQPVGVTVKEWEIVQESGKLAAEKDKPVVLSVKAGITKGAARVRVLVRDVATGHIGSRDLAAYDDKGREGTKASEHWVTGREQGAR